MNTSLFLVNLEIFLQYYIYSDIFNMFRFSTTQYCVIPFGEGLEILLLTCFRSYGERTYSSYISLYDYRFNILTTCNAISSLS